MYIEKHQFPINCKNDNERHEFCESIKNFFIGGGQLCHRNLGSDLTLIPVLKI